MFLSANQSRMISGIIEMITGKRRVKTRTMLNFGRSRHLKVGVSVGAVNNKDYKFN